mgnify:CR=1 FL=1
MTTKTTRDTRTDSGSPTKNEDEREEGGRLRRLTAFSEDPAGGNPAGVWLGAALPEAEEMQRIAAEVGYSETAFGAPDGKGGYTIRYYSPEREVSFCGHATIATGVVLGELHGEGRYRLHTPVGEVPVEVERRGHRWFASLTSVEPRHEAVPREVLSEALQALGWHEAILDPAIPPALAYAGAWHLVLAVADRPTLDALDYDFDALKRTMLAADLTTLQLVWREGADVFHARNPFPVGGVREDPATGAAAAALAGYLRSQGLMSVPGAFRIHQGVVMGRPSLLQVSVPTTGGITVTGTATDLERGSPENLARTFFERVWKAPADLDAIDELMAEDYVIHSAGTTIHGRPAFKAWVETFQSLLEGATNEVHDVHVDTTGTVVTTRWTCSGINRGIFGLPPDGAPIEFSGIAVWRVHEGKLAECWVERSALEAVRAWEATGATRSALEPRVRDSA